jgi:hypothetical protein
MGRRRNYADDKARYAARSARRTLARGQHNIHFTGVDGEGVGDGRDHRYVLLGVGDAQIENENGLSFSDIMAFLYDCYMADREAVFAGFFLGYDFAQWLRTLPENRARYLLSEKEIAKRQRKKSGGNHTPFPVRYDGWEFDLLAMKRFKLRPETETEGASGKPWMYINDSGPFFQTSLVKAIDPQGWSEPIVSEDEYSFIVDNKNKRATASLGPEMRKYNSLENEIFSRLMNRTNEGFTRAGIRLRRDQWFGPGQAAQHWLRQIKCPSRDDMIESGQEQYLELGRMTYYGGWFEIFAHGHIPGRTFEYDINSAYPYCAAHLPCFQHGEWTHNGNLERAGHCIVYAVVKGSDHHIGSMLHRLPDGCIRRPSHTAGYYWLEEVRASQRAGLIDELDIRESWSYTPCACRPPLRGLLGLYDERLRVGKNTALGKGLKLIYNSVYGKFAQSVGNPRYGNSLYASLITSGCRTMILDAIATHPRKSDAVVMVATDGVYFTDKHSALPISDKIGEWDVSEKQNLTLFKPGVYWDDKARERIRLSQPVSFKSRGISATQFASQIARIDNHYRDWGNRYPCERDPMGSRTGWHPRVTFNTSFSMVTPGQALEWGRWQDCGTLGHSDRHPSGCGGCNGAHLVQDSDPIGKRHSGWYDAERSIYWSRPYRDGGSGGLESTPYDKRFGQPDPDAYGWTDDGKVLEGFSWMLHDR